MNLRRGLGDILETKSLISFLDHYSVKMVIRLIYTRKSLSKTRRRKMVLRHGDTHSFEIP